MFLSDDRIVDPTRERAVRSRGDPRDRARRTIPDRPSTEGVAVSVLMRMDWAGVTPAQYDELRTVVNWEGDRPAGALSHVMAFDDAGAHVNDTWESAEQLQTFLEDRLMPGVQKVGIAGQPEVVVIAAHAVYIPGVTDR
jgi:hypothetical protein